MLSYIASKYTAMAFKVSNEEMPRYKISIHI